MKKRRRIRLMRIELIRKKNFLSRTKKIKKRLAKLFRKKVSKKTISKNKIEKLRSFSLISKKELSVSIKKRIGLIKIPENFSLYSHPENVLKTIHQISLTGFNEDLKGIFVDQSNCLVHDLAAEVLLSSTVSCSNAKKTQNGGRFSIKGVTPKCLKMKRLLRSVGIIKENASQKYHLPKDDNLKIYKKESYPLERSTFFSQDKKNVVTEEFPEYVDDCLSYINAKLHKDESNQLSRYIAEVLSNAEDHAGKKIWNITGYCDASDKENVVCEIMIYNIGKTIYETFVEKRSEPKVEAKWQSYVKRHIKSSNLNEEQLTIVYAMQENASSKLDEEVHRGQGTKDLMKLFFDFHSECNRIHKSRGHDVVVKPKMLIMSGNVMLKFDGTYAPSVDENEKMVFAVNKQNSLNMPPDPQYIAKLGNLNFPGTAIYIRFALTENNFGDK